MRALDATITLLAIVVVLLGPTAVGRATRKPLCAVVAAAVLFVPAISLQALDTNLPGFAVLIAAAGTISAALGVAAAKREPNDHAAASGETS